MMGKSLLEVNVDEKKYGSLPVLHDVHFTVEEKEYVSLVGPSGCGKTTLLRLIVGLENDYRGEIIINGHPPQLGYEMRMMFQDPVLFPWLSVRENIEFGLHRHPPPWYQKWWSGKQDIDPRVDAFLTIIGLEEFAHYLPSQLSGGMQQRVVLARSLVSAPKLLLLDEPFSKLDYLTALPLQQETREILNTVGATTLMITHNLEEAVYLSDRIVLLSPRPGTIVQEFRINSPWPRERMSEELHRLEKEILQCLQE